MFYSGRQPFLTWSLFLMNPYLLSLCFILATYPTFRMYSSFGLFHESATLSSRGVVLWLCGPSASHSTWHLIRPYIFVEREMPRIKHSSVIEANVNIA